MSEKAILIQPGKIFWDVFRGALISHGSNIKRFSQETGIPQTSVRHMAYGFSNGPKAKTARQTMIDFVGSETFNDLYVKHLEREGLLTND